MLVSSTEHDVRIRELGSPSTYPEQYGVDVLWYSVVDEGWIGVQRKEIKDFVASVNDGRLVKEVSQMRGLVTSLLIIEGRLQWTTDGTLLNGNTDRYTKARHNGLLWSLQSSGIWVQSTSSISETVEVVRLFEAWCNKETHSSLAIKREGLSSPWGKPNDRETAIYLVSGLPGIGSELAARIVDQFGIPWCWNVTRRELLSVPGLGSKKVEKLWALLGGLDEMALESGEPIMGPS